MMFYPGKYPDMEMGTVVNPPIYPDENFVVVMQLSQIVGSMNSGLGSWNSRSAWTVLWNVD